MNKIFEITTSVALQYGIKYLIQYNCEGKIYFYRANGFIADADAVAIWKMKSKSWPGE